MNTKTPATKRGAVRQYDAIMRACRRDLAGGLSFGMDWPTLRSTFPERAALLAAFGMCIWLTIIGVQS